MIQVYADGVLAYDNRLETYDLQGLTITTGLNKAGTAEIILPPGHPVYGQFIPYRSVVEIYRDSVLLFRGRALYTSDDVQGFRTVVCEGERCFFLDAISRPYLYQAAPAAVFSAVVEEYNRQVEEFKRFEVGTITVTDQNDYIRMESESAESVQDTLTKLVNRCGGYIVFTTSDTGKRVVNWLETIGTRSGQVIEFGENLLDYSRSGANTDLVTVVVPYGAKDEETGARLTIESVNDGLDYVRDDEAVALRGTIIKAVTWDDVTQPANLLRKARQYLNENRYIITTLELSALDLSLLDKDIDSYQVGDTIQVLSKPHGVDDAFQLTDRTENLLSPADSTITLGKETRTLTDADVAGDRESRDELHQVRHEIKMDYTLNIAAAVQRTEQLLSSLIEQTSESIRLEVSQSYTTNDELESAISTSLTQLADSFVFSFDELRAVVDENEAEANTRFTEISRYITFEDGTIRLGASDSAVTLTLENDMIVFRKNGQKFGWWDGVDFHTGNIVVEVNERAQFGAFAFVPRSNGSLSFLKVGE
jgi:phage minor structural protein